MRLRAARPAEARLLGELALRAKGHWGYDEAFLQACRAELTFTPDDVTARRITVAEQDNQVVAFYSLDGDPPHGELGNMWVDPAAIGTGLGRRLWHHAVSTAAAHGFTDLTIESEPRAEGFYRTMGAQRIGAVPSGSIPGRVLPLLRFVLPEAGPS